MWWGFRGFLGVLSSQNFQKAATSSCWISQNTQPALESNETNQLWEPGGTGGTGSNWKIHDMMTEWKGFFSDQSWGPKQGE